MNIRLYSLLIVLFTMFSFESCKTKTNQVKNNLKEGAWITVDTFDYPYISKGKYHKGKQTGSWKYVYNGKLDRKEKYKKNKCCVKGILQSAAGKTAGLKNWPLCGRKQAYKKVVGL